MGSEERGSEVEVRIRPFRSEDATAVHRWFNNADATSSLMETRAAFTEENARGWTEAAVRAAEGDGEDRKWAIEVEGVAEPVGFTALYGLFRQTAPELGALIGDPPGARGVGREAERLTVAKAFTEFGAHRVYGRIPAFNGPAKKAVTWQGWQHEGTMREHIRRPDGTLIDCEVWGITRAGWRERWGIDEDESSPPS
jgi:[ribosomal protein S5]-alanine N-acetyltransferase